MKKLFFHSTIGFFLAWVFFLALVVGAIFPDNTAKAQTNYTLTTAVSQPDSGDVLNSIPPPPMGDIACPGDCSESYASGSIIQIYAVPRTGYVFDSWSGACSGQTTTCCNLEMNGDKSATANFVQLFDYNLTNSGPSNVTKNPSGDAYTTNTITRTLTAGIAEAATITATGMPSGVSVSYDGNRTCSPTCSSTINFTISSSVTAGVYPITVTSTVEDGIPEPKETTFNLVVTDPATFSLTATVSPGGSGTISGLGISCPGDCTESFASSTLVAITASPSSGYGFDSWSGACSGQTTASCTLTMDSDKNTTANFVIVPPFDYNLTNSGPSNVTKNPSGDAYTTNTITRTLTAGIAEAATITATGMPSGVSVSYDGNRTCSPTCSSTITFTVDNSTTPDTYPITVTSTVGDGTPGPKQTVFNLTVNPAALSVTCSANPLSVLMGEDVTWTAVVSGGTPPFTYSWAGTDIPTSPAPSTNPYIRSYSTIGQKTAVVTVTDTVSVQATCNPTAVAQINFNPSFDEF